MSKYTQDAGQTIGTYQILSIIYLSLNKVLPITYNEPGVIGS